MGSRVLTIIPIKEKEAICLVIVMAVDITALSVLLKNILFLISRKILG
tara:strand:+ start:1176 stop:1319 length:144 start_codon:yes stop_codon:yes gene_type:complete